MTKRLITGFLLFFLVFTGGLISHASPLIQTPLIQKDGDALPPAIVDRCLHIASDTWDMDFELINQKYKTGEVTILEISAGEVYEVNTSTEGGGGGILIILEDL